MASALDTEGFQSVRASNSTEMTLHRQDRAFVGRLLNGDESAFDRFFHEHYPVAYRFALRRMDGDPGAAEEVAQATVCLALRRIATYRGEAALMTWVLTICRREIATWYRNRGRHAPEVAVEDLDREIAAALDVLLDAGDDPERSAERAEVRARIVRALDSLPPRHSSALRWKYIEGYSVREIAARLEASEKATESVLSRARVGFREAYVLLLSAAEGRHQAPAGGEP